MSLGEHTTNPMFQGMIREALDAKRVIDAEPGRRLSLPIGGIGDRALVGNHRISKNMQREEINNAGK